ncbi:unnamed protein product [Symbiodinium sp. CCMP2592]|nr:unnamed protein product [Symbiodinium sp. CCMP2592]
MEKLVHRGKDGQIVDVDDFQVAKALLAGEAELLSQEVDAEHLFDVCLRFGRQSTAAAMISHGVPGCVFKGPGSLPPPASTPACGPAEDYDPFEDHPDCHNYWGTSRGRDLRMEDWDAHLRDAKNAAERAAAMPLLRTLLEACRSQAGCSGIVTDEAMAYLLDVAILLGDAELARDCFKHCTCLPLRCWRFRAFCRITGHEHEPSLRAEIREKDILIAAFAAGLKLGHLTVEYPEPPYDPWRQPDSCKHVSLAEAIVLSGDTELWCRVEGLQPQLGPWPKHTKGNEMARFLLERCGGQVRLNSERMQLAERAGLALGTFELRPFRRFSTLSLLDLAILFGQTDCCRLCGPMDIEATIFTVQASLEERPAWEDYPCRRGHSTWYSTSREIHTGRISERQAAAAEALRAALQASFRRAASFAGFGLFQTMRTWSRGKSVPAAMVNLVLTFAAHRPSLLQALEGRAAELPSLGPWWEKSEHQDPESPQVAPTQPASTAEKESGPDQHSTSDLLVAIRNSKSENPHPPLSGDGVVIFRITRKANAEEVDAILFDATGPLWSLHRRVLEAGCEVRPEWSPARALFVPLTQPQLQELEQAQEGNLYEMGKLHLLAMESDGELIKDAFNHAIPRKVRPKLRRETLRMDEEEEDEPLLVVEGGVQTDSSAGYPVYAGMA